MMSTALTPPPREPESVEAERRAKAPALPTRIRVVVRVRPKLPSEAAHSTEILRVHQQRNLVQCTSSAAAKSFQFDQVFDGATSQRGFYEQLGVDRMLRAVLDGYHATVFAYGQTGSGKTFTMEGYDYERHRDMDRGSMPQARFEASTGNDRIGLIPRAIFTLFELMARATQDSSREFVVKCSFLQIYNEQILDLFNPSHFLQAARKPKGAARGPAAAAASKHGAMPGLRLRWSSVRDFYVENLRVLECTSPEHVLQHFQDGIKHKIMASHNLNAASSRSHCIFTIYVESFDPLGNPNDVLHSKLALVDLAGSERVDKTGATGVTLQESIGINKSLFVLRQVIQALSDESASSANAKPTSKDRSYIPYRDSKLTSLLKYSLGGNAWTLMIACLSPSDSYLDENLSTLLYAARAQSIANNPTKNEDPKTVLIHELKLEVESLRRQLAQAQEIILHFQQQSPSADNRVSSQERAVEQSTTQPETLSEPQRVETSSNNQSSEPPPAAKESSAAAKLKLRVIDNVEMIKQLYATEKQLHDRVAKQEARIGDLQHETRVLHVENQSLREKMEVLEYLLATQTDTEGANGAFSGDPESSQDPIVEEIPGYGALMTSVSGSALPRLVPSAERIRDVMGRRAPPTARASNNNNYQDATKRPSRPPPVDARASQPRRQKKSDAETGLLSLSELRDLLGGKKLSSATEIPPVSGSGPLKRQPTNEPTRPSTNPPPQAQPIPAPQRADESPTASILSMLQQQKLETGRSTLDKDPLESLSELNRLLRVKATLRRSSSFK